MGGKKQQQRTSQNNKADDQPVDPIEQQETPETPEKKVEAPAAPVNVAEEVKKQLHELPMATDANLSKAQKTVDAAVTVAKDVVKATVDQIKTQIGEENTQKAIDFANKAKSEVSEVVDFAKDAVNDATNKAKEKANAKVTEVKDKANAKVTEVKEKAAAKAVEVKDKATARVNETVDNLKHNEKVKVAAKKADDATRFLKGEIAETSLENKAVNITSVVIASALAASSAALGVVGLNKTATNVVTSVRSGLTGIATKVPLVQTVHSFANQYWPYQLAARMVVNVDGSVKKRLSKVNGENTSDIPTPTKPAAPTSASEKTSTTTA